MKAAPLLILIALAAWSATGCGQKGALVLPDAEHPRKKVKLPAAPNSRTPAQPAAPAQDPAPPPAADSSSQS
jgi:predicted small lipoprotein YifL